MPKHAEAARWFQAAPYSTSDSAWVRLPSTLALLIAELGQSASNTQLCLSSHHSQELLEETEKGFLKLWDMYQTNWQFKSFATNLPGNHFLCRLLSICGSFFLCCKYTYSTTRFSSSWRRVWEKSVLNQSDLKSFDNLYDMKWKVDTCIAHKD